MEQSAPLQNPENTVHKGSTHSHLDHEIIKWKRNKKRKERKSAKTFLAWQEHRKLYYRKNTFPFIRLECRLNEDARLLFKEGKAAPALSCITVSLNYLYYLLLNHT